MVNYDLPLKYDTRGEPDYEVYLHRIGRAGRFGRKGKLPMLSKCLLYFCNQWSVDILRVIIYDH